ncbi:MAG TPA: 23S rRNA (adenine(2030)-N(6))-methyltransferase RlmJ [Steroidobacteraceae bacterium]|nr:23S rRNA (adenine(2030)-N(6))-methyltransferase RlmJ [Steroidobacteraceae bacterium]
MQYRHGFHAGNFADVHKHIALLQLIGALQRKAKGFLCLETHAGEGLYDLAAADARQGAESDAGILRLQRQLAQSSAAIHPAIKHYMDAVRRIREHCGEALRLYPGSPLLAAAQLREADQEVCVEAQPQAARALQRAFDRTAALLATAPRVVTGDGYQQLRSLLPPPSRRGLVLVDPPYESADEEQQVAAALAAGLARFETGVFAVWYPIKKQHDSDLWLARVTRGIERPTLAAELCTAAPDHAAGLNGSGLLVVNPPWQFDSEAARWQAGLHELLGGTGGSTVRWLVHEQ